MGEESESATALDKAPKAARGRPKGARSRANQCREERRIAEERYPSTDGTFRGPGKQTVMRLRQDLFRALDQLDQRGKPLHLLIADSLEADTPKALTALSKFLPSDVKIEGSVSLVGALDEIGKAIDLELDRQSGDYVVHEDDEDEL